MNSFNTATVKKGKLTTSSASITCTLIKKPYEEIFGNVFFFAAGELAICNLELNSQKL